MGRQRTCYVYIMASKSHVVYVGVTGFLIARVLCHRAARVGCSHANIRRRGWFTFNPFITSATPLRRKTEIKRRLEKKVALIAERNPTWEDLAEGWGGPAVMRVEGIADSCCLASLARRNDKGLG